MVLAKKLALGLEGFELSAEVADVDNTTDLGAQVLGELIGDEVLVVTLRIGGDQADADVFGGVERVWEDDLARLET